MRGLVFALCSLIAAQSAFVPQSTFCATAEGQIACDVPCPASDADTGKNSTYCVTQTSQGFPGEYPAFQYCLSVGSPYLNPSSNACPARPAGKCADIGKVCGAKQSMGGAQECPPVGGDGCTGASCDGTCGCGCAKIQCPGGGGSMKPLGFPGYEPAPSAGCSCLVDDVTCMYGLCV